MDEIRRGERGKQKTWQWLMVSQSPVTTLPRTQPIE